MRFLKVMAKLTPYLVSACLIPIMIYFIVTLIVGGSLMALAVIVTVVIPIALLFCLLPSKRSQEYEFFYQLGLFIKLIINAWSLHGIIGIAWLMIQGIGNLN